MKKFIEYKYKVELREQDYNKDENEASDELLQRFNRGKENKTFLYNPEFNVVEDFFAIDTRTDKAIFVMNGCVVQDTKRECRIIVNNIKSLLKDTFQVKKVDMIYEASGDMKE